MAHCLLVTHLLLTELSTRNSGTYRRLSTLIDAVRLTKLSLRIYCTVPPEEALEPTHAIAEKIKIEIARLWHIDATIIVNITAPLPDSSWLLQQLRGISGYSRMPLIQPYFAQQALALLAQEIAAGPAFIVAHRLASMFALHLAATKLSSTQLPQRQLPPTFFDLDDIEHVVALHGLKKIASKRDRLFATLYLPALLLAEQQALRRAHLTLVCSQLDVARAHKLSADSAVDIFPNAIAIPEIELAPVAKPIMLMVGIYSYGPNADGADFFISEILPLVRAQMPDAELWFAGSSPERIAAFKDRPQGVRFLGFVDDLDSVYRSARLIICPIRYGSGTRVKLIEAAAWGKPIVSTPIGAEGLGMTHQKDILLTDDAGEFATHCLRLLKDDALCLELARNARELAENNFDRKRIVAQLAEKFLRAVERSK